MTIALVQTNLQGNPHLSTVATGQRGIAVVPEAPNYPVVLL